MRNKQRLLRILRYLYENTDENNGITMKDILNKLQAVCGTMPDKKTVYRSCGRGRYRVASDVGLHSIQRQVQHCGNLLIAVTLTLQLFDFYRIFVPHSNASF